MATTMRKRAGVSARVWIGTVPMALCVAAASAQPLTTTFAGGGQAAGIMFDVTASVDGVLTLAIAMAVNVSNGSVVNATIWSRADTYVGHESDPTGWAVAHESQGAVNGGLARLSLWTAPLVANVPTGVFVNITTPAGDVVTFTPIPPASASYANAVVTLSGGVAKGPGGFAGATTPRAMINASLYTTTCYANCDASINAPFLNIMDWVCFNNIFASGSASANCDRSTSPPILNVNDFICFMNYFAVGCSAP